MLAHIWWWKIRFPFFQLNDLEYATIFQFHNPMEFVRYELSLLLCLLVSLSGCHTQRRTGAVTNFNPFENMAHSSNKEERLRALDRDSRLTAISKHMTFICRHAINKPKYEHVLNIDTEGWVGLSHLHDVCKRVRDLNVTRTDVLDICQQRDKDKKLRFDSKPGIGEDIYIRVYQGQSFGTIRTDKTLVKLEAPCYLVHSTTREALSSILNEGLKITKRIAMHFIPAEYNARQEKYVASRKAPFILVVDASRAVSEDKQDFFISGNDVVLCDGEAPNCPSGTLDPRFIVALFRLGRHNQFTRLDLQAAKNEFDPIPEYEGPLDSALVPRPQIIVRRENETLQYRRIDSHPSSPPTNPTPSRESLIDNLGGKNLADLSKPTSKAKSPLSSPVLAPAKKNPLVFSPKGFVSKRSLPPPEHLPCEKSVRKNKYSSDQTTFAPGSIIEELPTLPPTLSDTSNPFGYSDREASSSSIPDRPTTVTQMAPTQEQWDNLTAQVIDSVTDYLRSNLPNLPNEDLPTQHHPVTWIMNRARHFDANFRPHRAPNPLTEEQLANQSPQEVRRLISVYGKRLARSVVPEEKQKRAAWRNFVFRTNQRLTQMVDQAEVINPYSYCVAYFSPTLRVLSSSHWLAPSRFRPIKGGVYS